MRYVFVTIFIYHLSICLSSIIYQFVYLMSINLSLYLLSIYLPSIIYLSIDLMSFNLSIIYLSGRRQHKDDHWNQDGFTQGDFCREEG